MKDAILNYVRERQGVSFAELSKDIPGFRGERTLRHTPHKNLFVWFDLSEEAVSALTELLEKERITVKVTNPLIYICDGMIPQAPVAKKLRDYATPHWLPVSISTP